QCPAVVDLPWGRPRPGAAVVAGGGPPVPPRETGDLGLIFRRGNRKARSVTGPSCLRSAGAGCQSGLKAIVRRAVTGSDIGWKRQRSTAANAARSNTRAGSARITRAAVTEPSVPIVSSTSTSPDWRVRRADDGYSGAGIETGRRSAALGRLCAAAA